MNNIELLAETIKNIKTVGTVTFSSKYLVKQMVAPIDFANAQCIVELGAGNGCITKALLQNMRPNARLLAFEVNTKFCELIQQEVGNDPRLILINDSAEHIARYLQQYDFQQADYIVSAVPMLSIPDIVVTNILQAVESTLRPKGLFIHLSYSPATSKKFERQFLSVKTKLTLRNLPPAFVFVCTAHDRKNSDA